MSVTGTTAGVAAAVEELQRQLPGAVDVTESVRGQHGIDEGWHADAPPDAVVYATSTEDVVTVVTVCAEHDVPVIPFGAGTSLEGHVAAIRGGVSVDMSQMDAVLEVNQEDLDCRVQAGVRRVQLNDVVNRQGLFFPIDPGADATIGGMASTRASGTNAVRYGTMRDAVLGLTVVLADGRVIRTGSRARKTSAGYDLTRLFVGAEGTLGIITEVQLRLHGIPEVIGNAVCSFPDVDAAVRTVIETVQLGVPVARLELLDAAQVAACNRYSELDLPEAPLLLTEFHGATANVEQDAATVRALAEANGASGFVWSVDTEERTKLWQARHDAYYAALALRPGGKAVPTDVCVPISRLAACISETRDDIERLGLTAPIVGHVGDGNFHVIVLFDPDDPDERRVVTEFHDDLVTRALAMGGTCTGEHGIGYGKLPYMRREHGEAVEVMRAVKFALDPHGRLNPGKVVPEADRG